MVKKKNLDFSEEPCKKMMGEDIYRGKLITGRF